MTKVLAPWAADWFESRGISSETAARLGIYTGKATEGGAVAPDPKGKVLVFPFVEHGATVNEKYRGPQKKFWQQKGGRRTFWNSDVLDDPALAAGHHALIICEGEPDCLTALDCGFPFSVSVPDGAPPVPPNVEPEALDKLDPATEQTGKFEFIWNNRARLKLIKRFILAVDNDPPGRRLAAELVRRLSASRCSFVEYPEGCKDLNDVRVKHGAAAVVACLESAKPYPVHGLYRLSDFPDLPPIEVHKTGWWTLDEHYRPFLGGLTIILGIPGHGKSQIVENLTVNLSEQYGWRAAIFSPEQPTVPHMRDRLRRIRMRAPVEGAKLGDLNGADDWIDDNILFIAGDPTGRVEEEAYLEWVLERAIDAVQRDGIRILIIDPWNEIEQLRRPGENQTEYIGRALRMINQFRRQYNVMVFLLVHPTKEVGKEGKSRPPTPYDCDGSAHFFNKADHFLVVHRYDEANFEVTVRVAKVKFTGTGLKGSVKLKFNSHSSRYEMLIPDSPEPVF